MKIVTRRNTEEVKNIIEVKKELETFHDNVDKLNRFASVVTLASIGLGAVTTLAFGPVALLTGSLIGAGVAAGLRLYTNKKKKDISTEVEDLEYKKSISHNEALNLKGELGKIYSDKPVQVY